MYVDDTWGSITWDFDKTIEFSNPCGVSSSVLVVTIDNRANYRQDSMTVELNAGLGGKSVASYDITWLLRGGQCPWSARHHPDCSHRSLQEHCKEPDGCNMRDSRIADGECYCWSTTKKSESTWCSKGFVDGVTIQYVLLFMFSMSFHKALTHFIMPSMPSMYLD